MERKLHLRQRAAGEDLRAMSVERAIAILPILPTSLRYPAHLHSLAMHAFVTIGTLGRLLHSDIIPTA
jgi:hypothetical protein